MASALVQFSTFWWIHLTGRNNLHLELGLQESLGNINYNFADFIQDSMLEGENGAWSRKSKVFNTILINLTYQIRQRLCWVKFSKNRAWGKDSWFIRRVLSGEREWKKQNWLGRQRNKNETQLIPQNSPAVLTKKGSCLYPYATEPDLQG